MADDYRLKKRAAGPEFESTDELVVWAHDDGTLRTTDEDGTVAEVGGGGGGSQANPITVAVPLEIDQTDASQDDLVTIKIPATYVNDSNMGWLLRAGFDPDDPNSVVFGVELQQIVFVSPAGEGGATFRLEAVDVPDSYAQLNTSSLTINNPGGPGIRLQTAAGDPTFRVDAGAVFFTAHTAPADGDLDQGEVALWFDQTNGAAKLMVKAKTADGTVVTGSVNLA